MIPVVILRREERPRLRRFAGVSQPVIVQVLSGPIQGQQPGISQNRRRQRAAHQRGMLRICLQVIQPLRHHGGGFHTWCQVRIRRLTQSIHPPRLRPLGHNLLQNRVSPQVGVTYFNHPPADHRPAVRVHCCAAIHGWQPCIPAKITVIPAQLRLGRIRKSRVADGNRMNVRWCPRIKAVCRAQPGGKPGRAQRRNQTLHILKHYIQTSRPNS